MKSFKDILGMTQAELKDYLGKYLRSKRYMVVSGDGYLYAKGDIPVLLTAHMDTVHKDRIKTIAKESVIVGDDIKTRLSSPEGIGGDDRCGVWMIMNILQTHKPSVLFCEDEEQGCKGSIKFAKTEYIKELGVNYMVELDRRGNNDAVFYSCDNKDFTKWIEEESGYKKAYGTCSDISKLMEPAGIAGVNFSCGYYKEHSKDEYIYVEEMNATMEMVRDLIDVKLDEPFKYVRGSYWGGYGSGYSGYSGYYGGTNTYNRTRSMWDDWGNWDSYYNNYNGSAKKNSAWNKRVSDYTTKLVVMIDINQIGEYGDMLSVEASSKTECWMELMMTYDLLYYAAIKEYWYE